MKPLVSVVMPVFNGEDHLRKAVDSILRQSMDDFELIIVDDGSTDRSRLILSSYTDSRIRIIENGCNIGLAASLNKGVEAARGIFIARMDSDDVSYPERLARQVEVLLNEPTLDLVATRAITIDDKNQISGFFPWAVNHEDICSRPWFGFYFPHPTWMGRIEWFRNHRYKVPASYRCEDQELLLHSYRDSRFATLDEVLFAYRVPVKTDWQKLATTRCAVFVMQWRYFLGQGEWSFALLAATVFVVKVGSDLLRRLWIKDITFKSDIVNCNISSEWCGVLHGLSMETKEP